MIKRIRFSTAATSLERALRTKLENSLKSSNVQVEDISGGCGKMFQIHVISTEFKGKSLLTQHKMVKQILEDDIKEMHGVTIKTQVKD